MNSSPVTAVIVHFNSRGDLARICADLAKQNHPLLDVVLVECGADGSMQPARAALGRVPNTLIDPGVNLGYCAGNNLGVRERPVAGDVLIVNPDVRLGDPGAIRALQEALHSGEDLAAVGPVVLTPEGKVEHAGSEIDWSQGRAVHVRTELEVWPDDLRGDLHEVPWLNGCCWLWRAAAADSVGELDPRFFLFFEEVDWAIRATAQQWRLAIASNVRAQHARSSSFGTSQKGAYYFWRNNYLLFRKHVGPGAWTVAWGRRLARFALAPRHLRSGAGSNALWGAFDALRGRSGPRPGSGRA